MIIAASMFSPLRPEVLVAQLRQIGVAPKLLCINVAQPDSPLLGPVSPRRWWLWFGFVGRRQRRKWCFGVMPAGDPKINDEKRKDHIEQELIEIVARGIDKVRNHESQPNCGHQRQRQQKIADPTRIEIGAIGAVAARLRRERNNNVASTSSSTTPSNNVILIGPKLIINLLLPECRMF